MNIEVKDPDSSIRLSEIANELNISSSYYFERSIIIIDGQPKYLCGLYQDGEIWSEDERYGTIIFDLYTYDSLELPYYIDINDYETVRKIYEE